MSGALPIRAYFHSSFEKFGTRPNSRGTVGSVMTIGLYIIGCAHSKNRFDVRRQGTLSIQPKLSEIRKQRQMVQTFPTKFPEIPKAVEFPNANHWTENSRNSGSKVEWKENFWEKIWVYLARLSSFSEILENAVPFATGSCRKFKPGESQENFEKDALFYKGA